jgi:hypothetical protein
MIRFAVIAGVVLGAGAAAVQLTPAPRAAVRPESERSLPASAFAAAAPVTQPLDINPASTKLYRTPWGETVAVDGRAPRIPLVQAQGWIIYANGEVAAQGNVRGGNPLTPIQ